VQDPKLLRSVPDEDGKKQPRDVADKVHNILKIFGLQNAAQTIVGNDMIRGVSGGEKKRVTLAEMMMGNHRVLLLGERSRLSSSCALRRHPMVLLLFALLLPRRHQHGS
jgi:ATPase subunit of ABC transporter with duplicated ATPase domains